MPHSFKSIVLTAVALLPLLGSAGLALAQSMAPPPPQAEIIPAPPHAGPGAYWAWRPGFWRWNGRAYHWIPGHYVRAPRAAAVWEPGGWVLVHGRYVWHAGHWRR